MCTVSQLCASLYYLSDYLSRLLEKEIWFTKMNIPLSGNYIVSRDAGQNLQILQCKVKCRQLGKHRLRDHSYIVSSLLVGQLTPLPPPPRFSSTFIYWHNTHPPFDIVILSYFALLSLQIAIA